MSSTPSTTDHAERLEHFEREAERERQARLKAEDVAERSLRHLVEQKERLELLQAILAAANAAETIQEAKAEALTLFCRHTGWPLGHVYRYRGGRLVPTEIWNAGAAGGDERFARWRAVTAQTTFARGEGLPGRVLASRRPAWIRDLGEEPDVLRTPVAAELGLHGAVAFPVLIGTEVEAVLEFFSTQPEEPDEALLELMAYAGSQLGYVVERQRLRRRHELILGAAGEGIYGLDAAGRMSFVNPTAAALVGWTADELLGRPQHEVLHYAYPDGTPYPEEACPIHQVLLDGQERRVTGEVFWRRDGTAFPVEYVATPVREGDELVGVVVVFHDVSEREELEALQAAERALREEARTLEVINDVNASIAAELEREPLVQTVTDAGTALTGAAFGAFFYNVADEQGGRYTLYTISGVEREAFSRVPMPRNTAVFQPTFSGEAVVRSDDITKDPRYGQNPPYFGMPEGHLPVRSYLAVPVKSVEGEVIGGLFFGHPEAGVFGERDERLAIAIASQAAIALQNADLYARVRASEDELLTLIDHLPELAWSARPDGHIDFYNHRWYEYTGATPGEMEGWGWEKIHDPAVLPEVVARWKHSIETGEPFEMAFPLRGADGAFRWFLTRIRPLRDAEGRVTRWIGTNTDIDEQKRTAAALEEARRDLAEANRLLEARVEERTAKLRESQALLHSVTAHALDGIAALEAVRDDEGAIVDFRWLLVNTQAEALYGRPAEALVGARQSEVLPGVKATGLHDALARVVETGEPFREEIEAPRLGQWFHLSASKLDDGVVVLFRDVSEAKQAEAALRASEAQLREAQKLAHVGSWRWDVAEDRVTWSDELYRIFGFEPGAMAVDYERYVACLHPDDREAVGEAVREAVAKGEGYELNHRAVRPDGSVRWIHSFGEVLKDEAGAVGALQGTAQDVTDRVEAEQALQRYAAQLERARAELSASAGFLQSTLDALTAHVAILDEDGTVVAVNEAWRRFARQNAYAGNDSGLGANYLEACEAPQGEAVAAHVASGIQRLLRGEIDHFTAEYPCHSPTEQRWFVVRVTRFDGPEGVRLVTAHENVTEMKLAQAELSRYARELEESNEELAKFAYVASHDLQEPLRMVTSFLQLLERRYEGQLDETAREYIAYAVDGARRMQRLIQDLLAYSRVGTRGREFEPVDSREVVLDVLHDLGPAIHDARADVAAEETLPTVYADPTQLHQLFLNLVGNALKFRREGVAPRIRIAAAPATLEGGRPGFRFTVADNGIGIDPQYADRIFQVFQRLHTREEYEGTGIGLAICKKIVERHGGTISVTSTPGDGATFTFTLPAPPAGAATTVPSTA